LSQLLLLEQAFEGCSLIFSQDVFIVQLVHDTLHISQRVFFGLLALPVEVAEILVAPQTSLIELVAKGEELLAVAACYMDGLVIT